MPSANVNATRMELTKQKRKLATSTRGHKLLKDKRDELMKQFLDMIRENRALRKKVEEGLMKAHGSFTVASAVMSSEVLEQSLLYPKQSVDLSMNYKNIMSVNVPIYQFSTRSADNSEIYPYGFATTSGELDDAVKALSEAFEGMLKLAEIEKTVPAPGGGDRKDPPPGQRPGVCEDPRDAGEHQVYHHEAGRERAQRHHPPDEGEGYAAQAVHRGAEEAGRGGPGGYERRLIVPVNGKHPQTNRAACGRLGVFLLDDWIAILARFNIIMLVVGTT